MNKTLFKEKKKEIGVYVDASYHWKKNRKDRKGKICLVIKNRPEVEEVSSPKIKGLKQYNNLFELAAIRNGIERAIEINPERPIRIISDSKTAVSWAKRGVNNLGKFSDIHYELKENIDSLRRNHEIRFEWIPRDKNLAGIELEKEEKYE